MSIGSRRWGRLNSLLLGLLVVAGFVAAAVAWTTGRELQRPGRYGRTLSVAGQQRAYWLYLPRQYDGRRPLPLVIVLHWAAGRGSAIEWATGFSEAAEQHGFIVVYPEGTGEPRVWNAGYCCGDAPARGIDDIAFLRTLLDELPTHLAIDRQRRYLTGMSNGAMLAHWAGAALADRVTAIAVVAGAIGGQRTADGLVLWPPPPQRPVATLIIHGQHDEQVPYAGGANRLVELPLRHLPVTAAVDFWCRANGCAPTASRQTLAGGRVLREQWPAGPGGAPVRLDTLVEAGHDWPGARQGLRSFLRRPAPDYDTTAVIWQFFAEQTRFDAR